MSIAILNWSTTQNFNFENDILILTMVDVGQGDGFILEIPTGQKIYIDIGDDYQTLKENRKVDIDANYSDNISTTIGSTINVANSILSDFIFSRNTADILFLTHDDADHAGALAEFARNERIGAFGLSPFRYTYVSKIKKYFTNSSDNTDKVDFLVRGMNFNFGNKSGFLQDSRITVLYPDIQSIRSMDMSTSSRAANQMSLIFKFNFGSTTVLFTGDSGFDEEKYLARLENTLSSSSPRSLQGYSLNSDILKVGHHGSKNSTEENFLRIVNPHIALISMGRDNKYGHPHSTVISKLEKYMGESNILRADMCGTIKLYIYKNGAVGRRRCDSYSIK